MEWEVVINIQWIKISWRSSQKAVNLKAKWQIKSFPFPVHNLCLQFICLCGKQIPGDWWFGRCHFPSSWFDHRFPGSSVRLSPIGCWGWGCPWCGSATEWWTLELKWNWLVPGGWWEGRGPKVLLGQRIKWFEIQGHNWNPLLCSENSDYFFLLKSYDPFVLKAFKLQYLECLYLTVLRECYPSILSKQSWWYFIPC